MLVGHFAAAIAAKRAAPEISFGSAMLASMLPDLLWCLLLLAGIEQVDFQAIRGASHYFQPVDIAWSHSLLMNIVWAAAFGAVFFTLRGNPRGGYVLFAAVLSHWLLDFIGNHDIPLAPGVNRRIGLNLWSSIPATLILEGGMWIAALAVYTRATRADGRAGVYGFWIVAALLTERWYANIAGPPPPNLRTAAIGGFVFFSLIVAWAYWMNRARPDLNARARDAAAGRPA